MSKVRRRRLPWMRMSARGTISAKRNLPCSSRGPPRSRYRWRNAAMLMLTFYHGLRVTELCRLKRQDVDLTHGRIWIQRLKGSLSTEQPLQAEELRTLKRYLTQRGNAQLPWLFLNERGDQ